MSAVVLVAVALGLSNFAAALGIGLSGVDTSLRVRLALIFAFFEAAMPLLGLIIGRSVATHLGSTTSYVGGGLLIATGIITVVQARRRGPEQLPTSHRLGALVMTGAALSIDNLVVGFALGTHKVPVVLAAVVIAAVSVAMSLVGLEIGSRLGALVEKWSAELGGVVLIVVGVVVAAGVI